MGLPVKNMLISAILLALFAIAGTGLVVITHTTTAERIADNERQALLRSLYALIPADQLDNDIANDVVQVSDPLLDSKRPVNVYRARLGRAPVAAVLNPIAPDGYGGAIKLLVAIRLDGTLAGVRVVTHKETPGLGDAIEAERSDWIRRFDNRHLDDPNAQGWAVRKDGGQFDQFTGATITPRAVVKAVYNTLRYYQAHREALFASPEATTETKGK